MPKTIAEREPFGIVFRAQGSETKAQAFGRLLEANPTFARLLEANRELCVLVGPVCCDSELDVPALSGEGRINEC